MKTHIKEWMELKGMSKEDLAEQTQISPKIIQKWLDEASTPSIAQLDIVSAALKVSMDDLVRKEPNETMLYENNFEEESAATDEADNKEHAFDPGEHFTFHMPLKEWIAFRKYTPDLIAKMLAAPVQVVQEWVDGTKMPSLFQVAAIAEILEVPIDDLVSSAPKEYYKTCLKKHIFETKYYSTAIRLHKWMTRRDIDHRIARVIGNKESVYMLRYAMEEPLSPSRIMGIILNPRNWDIREYMPLDSEDKYKGIDVINV